MNPLARDLDHVMQHTGGVWDELRHSRVFVTGGTGFFGCWLLETWARAWELGAVSAPVTVLTRSAAAFQRKAPHLAAHPAIRLVEGNVRSFVLRAEAFTHVIHAASDATPRLCAERPQLVTDTIVDGTRRVLDFAVERGAKRFLFTSSGAVYGVQPPHVPQLSESYPCSSDQSAQRSVYGEAKRMAERLCAMYGAEYGMECVPARCFAFVGPYLPLDAHFAIGNFIRDRAAGKTVRVNGDGAPVRSYLYAADLAIWLWTLLVGGVGGRLYNVGSERAVSIAELARMIAGKGPVEIGSAPVPGRLPERYVPCCERARTELKLMERVPLEDAIRRTLPAEWAREEAS